MLGTQSSQAIKGEDSFNKHVLGPLCVQNTFPGTVKIGKMPQPPGLS